MKGVRAAVRYAKAFLQLAKEKEALDHVIQDARMISSLVEESRDLELLLNSPLVKTDKKRTVLLNLFKGKVHDMTLSLINLVLDQKRESLLGVICQELIAQYNTINHIAKVSVTTAVALDENIKQELLNRLKSVYQLSDIELVEKIDKDLIGGMIMRMGDKQIDASIKRQLKDIEKELV